MPTTFRDRCHTPLSRDQAEALVRELDALIAALDDTELSSPWAFGDKMPAELDGLTVITGRALAENERDDDSSISDDLSIAVERDPPPDAEEARARAVATGYAAHSLVLEPAALERLSSCRSTIALEYVGRLCDDPRFVSLQRRLYAAAGPSVVESADGSRFEPSEARVAELAAQRGSPSIEGRSAKGRQAKPARKRDARPGEVEALTLREQLSEAVADPFVSRRLREALETTSELVRAYAGLILDDVAQADARAAKSLARTVADVEDARATLAALVASVSGER